MMAPSIRDNYGFRALLGYISTLSTPLETPTTKISVIKSVIYDFITITNIYYFYHKDIGYSVSSLQSRILTHRSNTQRTTIKCHLKLLHPPPTHPGQLIQIHPLSESAGPVFTAPNHTGATSPVAFEATFLWSISKNTSAITQKTFSAITHPVLGHTFPQRTELPTKSLHTGKVKSTPATSVHTLRRIGNT